MSLPTCPFESLYMYVQWESLKQDIILMEIPQLKEGVCTDHNNTDTQLLDTSTPCNSKIFNFLSYFHFCELERVPIFPIIPNNSISEISIVTIATIEV